MQLRDRCFNVGSWACRRNAKDDLFLIGMQNHVKNCTGLEITETDVACTVSNNCHITVIIWCKIEFLILKVKNDKISFAPRTTIHTIENMYNSTAVSFSVKMICQFGFSQGIAFYFLARFHPLFFSPISAKTFWRVTMFCLGAVVDVLKYILTIANKPYPEAVNQKGTVFAEDWSQFCSSVLLECFEYRRNGTEIRITKYGFSYGASSQRAAQIVHHCSGCVWCYRPFTNEQNCGKK